MELFEALLVTACYLPAGALPIGALGEPGAVLGHAALPASLLALAVAAETRVLVISDKSKDEKI